MKNKAIGTPILIAIIIVISLTAAGGYLVISETEEGGGPSENISENIPSAHYLGVPFVSQNASICYLGCTTMTVKYYEPNIELHDIITYTGSATGFKDYTASTAEYEEEDEMNFNTQNEKQEGGRKRLPLKYAIVPTTLRNLGYTPHIAYAGQAAGFVKGFKQEMDSEGLSSQNKLVERIKELIASDKPVIAWFYEDSWWKQYFESITGGPEPLVVTGYDENYMYAHVSTDTSIDENRAVPIDNFSDGWTGPLTPIILYVTESEEKKTAAEILSELKTYAENAPTNLRATADGLENGTVSLGPPGDVASLSFNLEQFGALRDNVAVFLREQGYDNVATKYENSAPKFRHACEISDHPETTPSDVADILREIATIENQAYNLWG